MVELGGLRFRWNHYSVPDGISLTERKVLLVETETTEQLEALTEFFKEVYTTLLTTREVYRFRRDPE